MLYIYLVHKITQKERKKKSTYCRGKITNKHKYKQAIEFLSETITSKVNEINRTNHETESKHQFM